MLKKPPARPRSAGGEPLRRRLHARGVGRPFGEPEQRAQAEQRLPVGGEAVRHADERPGDREDREAELQPDGVHDVAAERLQHDRDLEGAQDPRGTAAR